MPTRFRSVGRSEPPTPRWFHDTTRTPQPGSSSAGQAYALVPRPLQTRTAGPSASLVHTRSRVPSRLVTSENHTRGAITGGLSRVRDMQRLCTRGVAIGPLAPMPTPYCCRTDTVAVTTPLVSAELAGDTGSRERISCSSRQHRVPSVQPLGEPGHDGPLRVVVGQSPVGHHRGEPVGFVAAE